jgi:glucosyl-3-phosphoglycerate synthase
MGADGADDALLRGRRERVAVCLPALDEAQTVGAMVAGLVQMRSGGLIDELIVIDGGSCDGTGEIAAGAGARVVGSADIRADLGPMLGKGDGMWRGLQATEAELVCFLDADLISFRPWYVTRLLAPLLADPALAFVKSTFRRPLRLGDGPQREGGRVTEAVGRPLLARVYPELARFRQPLSGQIAARRGVLDRCGFAAGYGVDAGLLIDAARTAGADGLAEVDLGELHTVHQELTALAVMAREVATAVLSRARRDGRPTDAAARSLATALDGETEPNRAPVTVERPPLRAVS